MSVQTTGVNEIPSCHGGLENLDTEYDYELVEVEGDIPIDIKGTFFRNGPGRQRIGETKYGQPILAKKWLPCVIKKGEGLFLVFDKDFIYKCLNDQVNHQNS